MPGNPCSRLREKEQWKRKNKTCNAVWMGQEWELIEQSHQKDGKRQMKGTHVSDINWGKTEDRLFI